MICACVSKLRFVGTTGNDRERYTLYTVSSLGLVYSLRSLDSETHSHTPFLSALDALAGRAKKGRASLGHAHDPASAQPPSGAAQYMRTVCGFASFQHIVSAADKDERTANTTRRRRRRRRRQKRRLVPSSDPPSIEGCRQTFAPCSALAPCRRSSSAAGGRARKAR